MRATGIPHAAEPKRLPTLFREAARREAARYGYAFRSDCVPRRVLEDALDLWVSFTETQSLGATQNERVLGLLLLAEVLETAE